jgi:hypothetical protein
MDLGCIEILVIGDRFECINEDLKESFRQATNVPVFVRFCPDCDFFLSRLHLYAEYKLIIVNWSKQAALVAMFSPAASSVLSKRRCLLPESHSTCAGDCGANPTALNKRDLWCILGGSGGGIPPIFKFCFERDYPKSYHFYPDSLTSSRGKR